MKDQVSGSFLERRITLERCHASAEEEHAFAVFAEMQLEMDLGKTRGDRPTVQDQPGEIPVLQPVGLYQEHRSETEKAVSEI